MEMNEINEAVKRRGKRSEATHRIWVTFTKGTFEALSKQSKALGYAIGALTRIVIDRAVVCGLLTDDLPSLRGEDVVSAALAQELVDLSKEDGERIRLLTEVVDLQQRLLDQMQQQTDTFKTTILRQAVEISIYETDGVTDA